MHRNNNQRLAISPKSVILSLLTIVAAFSVEASDLKDFFTSEQLSIMSKASDIQRSYSEKTFNILQILSPSKALVSCGGWDGVLSADFSGKVDGENISVRVKDAGTESYTTVTPQLFGSGDDDEV